MIDQMTKEDWIKSTMKEMNIDEMIANKMYSFLLFQRTDILIEKNPLVGCVADDLVKITLAEYGFESDDLEPNDLIELKYPIVKLAAEVVTQLNTYTPNWKQGKSQSEQIAQVVDHAHNGNKEFDEMLLRLN